MLPPKAAGTVKWIAGDGDYKIGVSQLFEGFDIASQSIGDVQPGTVFDWGAATRPYASSAANP